MDYYQEYLRWQESVSDPALRSELGRIRGDDDGIRARFLHALRFGTAGLRGIIGAGTSRMNIYTVGWATQGLADYINERYGGGAVAIAYDSRRKSREFAERAASVLAKNGITAFLYDRLMPTPMLSFAVRELSCKAGIMITASHNPAEYNGYKVYGADGCQMTSEDSDAVLARINRVDVLYGAAAMDFDEGIREEKIRYIGKRVAEHYYEELEKQQLNPGICLNYPLKVVYTPLNGTGNIPVRRVLSDIGLSQVTVVPEQELPDGDFPTAPYPNPEMPEALKLGLELSRTLQPDIFLATDPDADRVGLAVRRDRDYRVLTGNEIGILLLNYIITARRENRAMPKNPVAIRSAVSTPMADKIAGQAGVEMRRVLTGFKYIGEQILLLEQKGEEDRFIFGFEESCGYLAGGYVRDKDAMLACMLIAEMTSYYRSKNQSVPDVLEGLYKQYGFYINEVVNIDFPGTDGAEKMAAVMKSLRASVPEQLAGRKVVAYSDYENGIRTDLLTGEAEALSLPQAEIVEYQLEQNGNVIIRPSGTEPKMKIYLTASEETAERSRQLIGQLSDAAKGLLTK